MRWVAVYDLGGGTFDAAVVGAGSGPGEGAKLVGRPDGLDPGGLSGDGEVLLDPLPGSEVGQNLTAATLSCSLASGG